MFTCWNAIIFIDNSKRPYIQILIRQLTLQLNKEGNMFADAKGIMKSRLSMGIQYAKRTNKCLQKLHWKLKIMYLRFYDINIHYIRTFGTQVSRYVAIWSTQIVLFVDRNWSFLSEFYFHTVNFRTWTNYDTESGRSGRSWIRVPLVLHQRLWN